MRLSTVCELLLIFLIIAFGAYGRVIERNGNEPRQIAKSLKNDKNIGVSLMSVKDVAENVNKYCQCDGTECTCCRAFHLIDINILKNEGCAVLKYVGNNSLKVQLKYGGRELVTRVIKGKSPEPICIPLPGGFSDFCANVYSISREEENNRFKACLGLELKSGGDVEASVRVSCFRFGQEGIKQLPAEDFPVISTLPKPADDDDDDIFGFDDDDDDDDDDEDDEDEDSEDSEAPVKDNVETPQKPDTDEDEDDDDEDDDDDDDLGLGDISGIFDFFTGGDDNKKKPSSTTTTTSPFIISTVTKQPAVSAPSSSSTANNKKPAVTASTSSSTTTTTTTTTTTQQPSKATTDKKQSDKKQEIITEKTPEKIPEITTETALESTTVHQDNDITTEQTFDYTTPKEADGSVTEESSTTDMNNPTESTLETTTFVSEKMEEKPIKESESVVDVVTIKPETSAMVVKKIIVGTHKKASAGSTNLNKIENDKQKPLIKPTKADSTPVQQVTPTNNNDDEETESVEDNDDEETEDNSTEEEKDENAEVEETDNDDEEEADILDSLDDDSEEQEVNAAINAIVGTKNNKNKNSNNNKIKNNNNISDKVADNMASKPEDDDADYGMNLAEFMARGRHINSGRSRQSKVMRL